MPEITAEATRNPEIAATLCGMDAESAARLTECMGGNVRDDAFEARLEVLIAILHGICIRSIVNPDIDKSALMAVVREITGVLLRPPFGDGD